MPGAIAKNAQEGTRSEYLAQYALSAFGTAIPVPHPEDSGIDLYCTLGVKVGRRFLIKNYYLVQVKSSNDPIVYNGKEEVKWLLSHNYPFLICVVNKKAARIELYQTNVLSTLSAKTFITTISLYPQSNQEKDYFPEIIDDTDVELYLGDPVVKFSVQNFDKKDFREKISQTLKSWIELDQENIDLKSTGFSLYRIPETWKTNMPVIAKKFTGNFKDYQKNKEEETKFNELFLKYLSQLVNQAASELDRGKYDSLIKFIKHYISVNEMKDGFAILILQFCINEGNKIFGIPCKLLIYKNDYKNA